MGRHASAGPEPEPGPEPVTATGHLVIWAERVLLGIAAGVGILVVLHWAGTPWSSSLWIAAVVAVLVPAAAWLASTVPGNEHHRP
ncbi:hypothetical protein [Cellulomonas sp. URHD0024]|uniref:hypothetical protein n=1 Tax=Cellulomonas sp. URHD0024 TaxID=1302620 RepID=UPI0003F50E03|nr:hypothetical protein [Cellulomonas sp. URHD0024]